MNSWRVYLLPILMLLKSHLNPSTSPASFNFPADRIVTLQDQVPESDLVKQPMLDANATSAW